MKIETSEQLRKTREALGETERLIKKEERYSKDLQKVDYLRSLYAHADKLKGMIEKAAIR